MSNVKNAAAVLTKPNPAFVDMGTTPDEPETVPHDRPYYEGNPDVALPVAGTVEYDPTGKDGPELLNFKDGNEDQARQDSSDAEWDKIPAKKKAADIEELKGIADKAVLDDLVENSINPDAVAYRTARDA